MMCSMEIAFISISPDGFSHARYLVISSQAFKYGMILESDRDRDKLAIDCLRQ